VRNPIRELLYAGVLMLAVSSLYAGAPPKAGWTKATLFAIANASATPPVPSSFPNATAAAKLASEVPFDILEDYGYTLLFSVATDNLARLRDLAAASLMRFERRDYLDVVWTWAGTIDTRLPVNVSKFGLPDANYQPGEWGTYLIQFHGPLDGKPEWLSAVRATGALPVQLHSVNAYIIAATPEIAREVAALPFVQWSTAWHPYFKRSPAPFYFVNGVAGVDVHIAQAPGTAELIERIRNSVDLPINQRSIESYVFVGAYMSQHLIDELVKEPLVADMYPDGTIGTGGAMRTL